MVMEFFQYFWNCCVPFSSVYCFFLYIQFLDQNSFFFQVWNATVRFSRSDFKNPSIWGLDYQLEIVIRHLGEHLKICKGSKIWCIASLSVLLNLKSCFIRNKEAVVIMEISSHICIWKNNNLRWTALFINYKQFETFKVIYI